MKVKATFDAYVPVLAGDLLSLRRSAFYRTSDLLCAGALLWALSFAAQAYDGTSCKEPGNCWEPKPGYPEKIAGSKYDPKHDPKEINKQQEAISAMEARNLKRYNHFKKTGKFVYDVSKID